MDLEYLESNVQICDREGEEFDSFPVGNYMFKVNNRNTRTRCEICSKLTTKVVLNGGIWRATGSVFFKF